MSKATKICGKCGRGLPENSSKCSCGSYDIFDKKECEDIINQYHRSSEKEKYQMFQNPRYRRILNFKLDKNEITSIQFKNNTQSRYKNKLTSQPKPSNVPKCPTCGSTNVHPISAGKKAMGFLMVGVFSKNFGKNYECDDCKYRW